MSSHGPSLNWDANELLQSLESLVSSVTIVSPSAPVGLHSIYISSSPDDPELGPDLL